MSGLVVTDEMREAAEALATFRPHNPHLDGFYRCQWPEQGPEDATARGSWYLGHGCRGCLIGMVARHSVEPVPCLKIAVAGGSVWFEGDEAVWVGQEAVRLAAGNQRELLTRHSAEVVAS